MTSTRGLVRILASVVLVAACRGGTSSPEETCEDPAACGGRGSPHEGGGGGQGGEGGKGGEGMADGVPEPSDDDDEGMDVSSEPEDAGMAVDDDDDGSLPDAEPPPDPPRYTIRDPGGRAIDIRACEPAGQCAVCPRNPTRPVPGDDPQDYTVADFPGPIHVPGDDRIMVVEAEDLPHSGNWTLVDEAPNTRDGSTFTGRGFLRWTGAGSCCEDMDRERTLQGSRCDWLVVKFFIPPGKEGFYTFEARGHNRLEDGDNDIWVGYIERAKMIYRAGHGPAYTNRFAFGSWFREPAVRFEAGLYAFYYMGRSRGFALDRIVMFPLEDRNARMRSHDLDRPTSKRYPAGWFDDFLDGSWTAGHRDP